MMSPRTTYTRSERLGMLLILVITLALCGVAALKSSRRSSAKVGRTVVIQTVYSAPDSTRVEPAPAKKKKRKRPAPKAPAPLHDNSPFKHPVPID